MTVQLAAGLALVLLSLATAMWAVRTSKATWSVLASSFCASAAGLFIWWGERVVGWFLFYCELYGDIGRALPILLVNGLLLIAVALVVPLLGAQLGAAWGTAARGKSTAIQGDSECRTHIGRDTQELAIPQR